MLNNKNLKKAQKVKNDEFYTQIEDIEKEIKNYKQFLENKIIYCNCDNPFFSNFVKYFLKNFNKLHLKGLFATGYEKNTTNIQDDLFDIKIEKKKAFKLEINSLTEENENEIIKVLFDKEKLTETLKKLNFVSILEENGDYKSKECLQLLKKSDIVITNPPFSLINEYFYILNKFKKDFLLILPINSVAYSNIFFLLKNNIARSGYSKPEKFLSPDNIIFQIKNIFWLTSLPVNKNEELILTKKYSKDYIKYDTYDAIECSNYLKIPYDYDKDIGIPITFIKKINSVIKDPSGNILKYKIVGLNALTNQDINGYYGRKSKINGVETFKRIFIKKA